MIDKTPGSVAKSVLGLDDLTTRKGAELSLRNTLFVKFRGRESSFPLTIPLDFPWNPMMEMIRNYAHICQVESVINYI